ncbi:hypothetical protein DM860_001287 [Cuscuta australis]|uniref:Protein kinase domain-containing protein n=1 Tax=Cuscuta australis TaxID=267555 RepID=A0A328DTA2_9ASTE|nr:hypothetical protein DM860_001287 [Cuscuta australis]
MDSLSKTFFLFFFFLLLLSALLLTYPSPCLSQPTTGISLLMAIKASLDPQNLILSSWSPNATDPCKDFTFEGIACNGLGQVVNISLQGKGLYGKIPPEIGHIKTLSGLYLHFNHLHGSVPREIANLTQLSDLYLSFNHLSGSIPSEIGNMSSLQVLQLCYNKLNGNIPTQLGSLKNLTVLALQSNSLTGAIPASLGDLTPLRRLDLSFNYLFGSIPTKLANAPMLEVLDVRNNTLSGNIPLELKRLNEGFQYTNNLGLCGIGFSSLKPCSYSAFNSNKPEPIGPGSYDLPTKVIPESANVQPHVSGAPRKARSATVAGVAGLTATLLAFGLFTYLRHRRQKQRIGSTAENTESRLSTDRQPKEFSRITASPLINVEYSNGWDPLGKGQNGNGFFSEEVLESFMFNLDEVESATQHFSETNLLGKSSFSAIYKGSLRDGSAVAVKCISRSSCKSDEAKFRKGLKLLISLKHENLLRLRGFCCSKDRGECFLIYNFLSNGCLLQYLDVKNSEGKHLDWPTRVSIIKGIARGIEYLHGNKGRKAGLVHRNISAEKVLIDDLYNPLLSDSGLHKLLAEDTVFSTLKGSAAMGCLAPEYTITGRFTKKSDIYAFGVIIFQILSGKLMVTHSNHQGAELCKYEAFVDPKLGRDFAEPEAAILGKMALLCTHESPSQRPTIEMLIQELDGIC